VRTGAHRQGCDVKAPPVGPQPLCIRIVAARLTVALFGLAGDKAFGPCRGLRSDNLARNAVPLEAVEFGGLHQAGVYRSISQDACVSSRKTVAEPVCILAVGAVYFAGRNDGGPEWKVES